MKRERRNLFNILQITIILLLVGILNYSIAEVKADQVMTPHILTTGSSEDLAKRSTYMFESDGTEIYKLVIPQNGCLQIRMYAQKAGYIATEVYKKTDASDMPTYFPFQCTYDQGNQATLLRYMKKGTYYLRFPQNSYNINMILYSSQQRTVKNGSTVAAYCNVNVIDYFVYKSNQTGFITIDQTRLIDTAASMSVSLNTEKGKKLTDIISDHAIDKQIVFPVKKGKTYKIGIKTLDVDGHQYYQMKIKFYKELKQAGTQKKSSPKLKLKQTQKGIIFAEDSKSVSDWYKFTNSSTQQLNLTCSGFVTSGSIRFTIYNAKGKKINSYDFLAGKGDTIKHKLGKLKTGTYYIKITKARKETAGVYQFSIKK